MMAPESLSPSALGILSRGLHSQVISLLVIIPGSSQLVIRRAQLSPSDLHGSAGHRLWPGVGPIPSPEPSTVVMAETFLLSRLTSYAVFGSLGDTDHGQAHLSTKSQWVERPSPGTYLLGSELDDKQPQVSMATSISSPKAKGVGVGRRRFCVLKPPYP